MTRHWLVDGGRELTQLPRFAGRDSDSDHILPQRSLVSKSRNLFSFLPLHLKLEPNTPVLFSTSLLCPPALPPCVSSVSSSHQTGGKAWRARGDSSGEGGLKIQTTESLGVGLDDWIQGFGGELKSMLDKRESEWNWFMLLKYSNILKCQTCWDVKFHYAPQSTKTSLHYYCSIW